MSADDANVALQELDDDGSGRGSLRPVEQLAGLLGVRQQPIHDALDRLLG